ncbi:hypothetical protein BGZ83_003071 [Gryganskiella cystojenkinii]|nr:hypothetical protein BGZ83_003071 [Gryganskiella cystojenkinii]
MCLPPTFLDQSLANFQRTTMYQLLRQEFQKPPKQLVRDNWPRAALGLLTVVSLGRWYEEFKALQEYITVALPYLVLKHAQGMYKFTFIGAIGLTVFYFAVRQHQWLPNLWPWILRNDPYWEHFLHETLAVMNEEFYRTTWFRICFDALWVPVFTGWSLRAFIMDLKSAPRTWWGGAEDKKDRSFVERTVDKLASNKRMRAITRNVCKIARRTWRRVGPWLAMNWPKFILLGMTIGFIPEGIVGQTCSNLLLALRTPLRGSIMTRSPPSLPSSGSDDNLATLSHEDKDKPHSATQGNESLVRHAQLMVRYTIVFYTAFELCGLSYAYVLKMICKWPSTTRMLRHLYTGLLEQRALVASARAEYATYVSTATWQEWLTFHLPTRYMIEILTWWTLRTLLKDLRGEPRTWWGGDLQQPPAELIDDKSSFVNH